jgi:hypothetical protein
VCFGQKKFTVSGIVKSESTGETVINASVKVSHLQDGTFSNEYGFYSLTLPAGEYELQYSAIGFETVTEKIELKNDLVKNISLPNEIKNLEEVTVNSNATGRTISNPQMSVEKLSMTEIKTIPMLLGERDILKAIQLLPGIKSAGDGNSGFYVRGGSADQNLILLDEAVVYNASHLMGFFSTFNPDVVKDITVYKGGMPAQYGGRLSSVLDIKMNDGNNQDVNVSGGLGIISAKLNVEGPIQKGKSSFLISGRRSYADVFTALAKDSSLKHNKLYFYDLNMKMNYILGKKDRLYLSGYFGRDFLKLDKQFGLDWGNATGTLRWNHIFSNKIFSNTSFIYSNFDYNIALNSASNNANIFSQIKDVNLKQEFQWYAGDKHTMRFGFNSIYHNIKPGEVTGSGETGVNDFFLQNRYSWDNAAFFSDVWRAARWLNITYGARLTSFGIYGAGDFYQIDNAGNVTDTLHYRKGELVKNYLNLEPRLAMSFIFNNNASIKISYVRNVQNLHLIANSITSFPTDKWIASTNIIKPEISDLYALGWYKNLNNKNYEITVETYYKQLFNQIDYKTDADIYTNDAIESQLLFGIGRAYGLETMLKKKNGKLTGWLAYTLSKTEKNIAGINNGNWYNARQDRTHDVAIVANYQLNKNWNLSANWVYYTGDAVTFPAGKYVIDNQIVFYYTERNSYRMPAYHRLDLGAVYQWKGAPSFMRRLLNQAQTKRWTSELAFSIFNAYGRENAYIIYFRQNEKNPGITETVQTSLFKFVPSISYNFKF